MAAAPASSVRRAVTDSAIWGRIIHPNFGKGFGVYKAGLVVFLGSSVTIGLVDNWNLMTSRLAPAEAVEVA
jgi:hypothetical protein